MSRRATPVSRRITLRSRTVVLLGFVCVATPGQVQTSASLPPLATQWVAPLGPADPSGFFRFTLCPDRSTIAYASPNRLYSIDAAGVVVREQMVQNIEGARSLDCTDVVRLLNVLADRHMEVVEFSTDTLAERARRPVSAGEGVVADGLKVLNGEEWLHAPDPVGAGLLVRPTSSGVPEKLGLQLPRAGSMPGNRSVVTPVFYRHDDHRYVYLQTDDYSIVEFTRQGAVQRVWRRDDTDFATVRPNLLPNGVVEDEMLIGAAWVPDAGLAVQVTKRRSGSVSGGTYVERLDADYNLIDAWSLPEKGMLFGADVTGALYFGYAGPAGLSVIKAHAAAP